MNDKKYKIELLKQAIKEEEKRVKHIEIFLEGLSLNTDINITVSLELMTQVPFIEHRIEKLKNRLSELEESN